MKVASAVLAILCCFSGIAAAPTTGYHLVKKIPVGGEGSWDYLTVDQAARRLYVSHETQVEVLDVDSGTAVGKIPNTPGVHGIAIATEFGRGFVTDGRADSVTIFDLKSLKELGQVKTGSKPDAIVYDPATRRVLAMNGDSDSATVIDAADGKVAGTIDLGGGPEFAVADGKGKVFVNLEDKNILLELDPQKLAVNQRWPLAPCQAPSSMAMDRHNRRLFIGCRSHVMAAVDADNGHVITVLPIGDHVDATAFDPETGLIFNSNGDGTVTVIHQDSPNRYSVVDNLKTEPRAKTMAFDPKTRQLLIPCKLSGNFTILVFGK